MQLVLAGILDRRRRRRLRAEADEDDPFPLDRSVVELAARGVAALEPSPVHLSVTPDQDVPQLDAADVARLADGNLRRQRLGLLRGCRQLPRRAQRGPVLRARGQFLCLGDYGLRSGCCCRKTKGKANIYSET